MRVRNLLVVSSLVFFFVVSGFARQAGSDPLSGTWTGDWGPTPRDRNPVTVELKWDGKALTGHVNPGPNAVELTKTTFNASSGAVHMEAKVNGPAGQPISYNIDGKIEKGVMSGSWNHDDRKGDFKITKK